MSSLDANDNMDDIQQTRSKNKIVINYKSTNGKEIEKYDQKDEDEVVEIERSLKNKKEKLHKPDENIKSGMGLCVTEKNVSDHEDNYMGADGEDLVKVNSNYPRITISEAVDSPRDSVNSLKRHSQGREQSHACYGIKSYIHDFYLPPDKEILRSGEYTQGDDFQWVVEPGKRRWTGCWFRTGLWVGINLMLLGIISMLVGHLTTPRQTIVSQQEDCTVMDHGAVTFNNRLVICQFVGLVVFICGAAVIMLALLMSSYYQEQTHSYFVMSTTVVPQTFVGTPTQRNCSHAIPLSSYVSGVQPVSVHQK